MATLNSNTMVQNPADGTSVALLAGEEIPDWAADQVGDHLLGDGNAPRRRGRAVTESPAGQRYPTAKEIAAEVVALLRQEMDDDQAGDADADQLPPTSGRGSGLDAWVAYADAKGIAYPEGATRDEIVAAVEAHQAGQ